MTPQEELDRRDGIVAAVIASATPMVVVEIPSGVIVAGNAAVATLVAVAPEELRGRSALSFISPELVTAAEGSLDLLAQGSIGGYRATRNLVRSDGTSLAVEGWTRRISEGLAVTALVAPSPADHDDAPSAEGPDVELRRITSDLYAAGLLDPVDRSDTGRLPLLESLTPRQLSVLSRLMAGDRVPTIAKDLYISQSTVRSHLAVIFRTFNVHTQAELLALLR